MPVLDGVKTMAITLYWQLYLASQINGFVLKEKKKAYCWTRSRPTWTFGESDDQVRDKSESKYQRVQDKSETIEKCLESGLEYYSPTELNNDHLNNPRRWRKHRGRCAGIRNRLRKRAHSPPLLSILLANVQSLENKMDDLRARISFQWDIRDCNILCLTETWLTPTVPDTAVMPSDNFSVLRMDRTAKAGKNKGGGVCFMINKKWCDPRSPFCRAPARLI